MLEQEAIYRSIIRFVVSTESALSIVENQEFKNMIHLLLPQAPIPCRQTVSKHLTTFAVIVKEKVILIETN